MNALQIKRVLALAAGPTATWALAGCGAGGMGAGLSGGPGGGGAPGQQLITAASGGAVTSSDKSVAVSLPPGALAADTMITVSPGNSPAALANYSSAGPTAALGPDGTTFNKPVTVTMNYGQLPAGATTANLQIISLSSSGLIERLSNIKVDTKAGTVSGDTMHFSTFKCIADPGISSGVTSVDMFGGSRTYGTATTDTARTAAFYLQTDGSVYTDKDKTPMPGGLTFQAHFAMPAPGQVLDALVSSGTDSVSVSLRSVLLNTLCGAFSDQKGSALVTIPQTVLADLAKKLGPTIGSVTVRLQFYDPKVTSRTVFVYPTWFITFNLPGAGGGLGAGGALAAAGFNHVAVGGLFGTTGVAPIFEADVAAMGVALFVNRSGMLSLSPYGGYTIPGIGFLFTPTPPASGTAQVSVNAIDIAPDPNGVGAPWGITINQFADRFRGQTPDPATGGIFGYINGQSLAATFNGMEGSGVGSVTAVLVCRAKAGLPAVTIGVTITKSPDWGP